MVPPLLPPDSVYLVRMRVRLQSFMHHSHNGDWHDNLKSADAECPTSGGVTRQSGVRAGREAASRRQSHHKHFDMLKCFGKVSLRTNI